MKTHLEKPASVVVSRKKHMSGPVVLILRARHALCLAGKRYLCAEFEITCMASHNELGRLGEEAAVHYLVMHGYHILELDWHYGHCDIDIVAEKLGFIIFVEVKTRVSSTFQAPEAAVDRRKMSRLLASGHAYLIKKRLDWPYRFDIVAVEGTGFDNFKIRHIKDAFDRASLFVEQAYDGGLRHQTHISADDEAGRN